MLNFNHKGGIEMKEIYLREINYMCRKMNVQLLKKIYSIIVRYYHSSIQKKDEDI